MANPARWPGARGVRALLSLTLLLLFAGSWVGHLLRAFAEFRGDALTHGQAVPTLAAYAMVAATLVRVTAELAERVSSRSRPWSGWRYTCGSVDRRRARPCMWRTTITTETRPSRPAATCRKTTLTAAAYAFAAIPGHVEPLSNRTGPCQGATISAARRSASLAVLHRLIEDTLSAVIEDPVSGFVPADDHIPDRDVGQRLEQVVPGARRRVVRIEQECVRNWLIHVGRRPFCRTRD